MDGGSIPPSSTAEVLLTVLEGAAVVTDWSRNYERGRRLAEHEGKVRFAILATHVQLAEGIFSMLGAGWNLLTVNALPAFVTVNLAAQVSGVPESGLVLCELRSPQAEVLARTSTLVLGHGDDANEVTNLLLQFPFEAREIGTYQLVIGGPDVQEHVVDFQLRHLTV